MLLSCISFALGYMLFKKRNLLKGRVVALENGILKLASSLEENQSASQENEFEPRDIAIVGVNTFATIKNSDFWEHYKAHLEKTDGASLKINSHALRSYYDNASPGSTKHEVSKIISAAKTQHITLTETRFQLEKIRKEHENAILDGNSHKQKIRGYFNAARDMKASLLETTRKTERLIKEIEVLRDVVDVNESDLEKKQDVIYAIEEKLKHAREQIKNVSQVQTTPLEKGEMPLVYPAEKLEAGEKGHIVLVNNQWNYIILAINDKFLREIVLLQKILLANNVPSIIPSVNLLIKRGSGYDTFVTRARLTQINLDSRLAILDIDHQHQKLPVEKGDIAFY